MTYPLGTVVQGATKWVETITATGTWTVPSVAVNGFDVTNVQVECIGGGAGGVAGSVASGSGGGGGGAYSKTNSLAVTPAAALAATVGAGGAGGAAGGDTSFVNATTAMAKGGAVGSGTTGGVGGSATSSVGDTKFKGGDAQNGGTTSGGGGGGGAGDGGAGGNAPASPPGTPGNGTATGGGTGGTGDVSAVTPGTAGSVQGGGGGGGGPVSRAGLAGGRGYIILTYNKQFGATPSETTATQPAAATIGRAFVGARTASETVTLSDVPTRLVAASRSGSETVGPATDTIARVFVGSRKIFEVTPTANLLSWNRSTLEISVSGWTALVNCSIAQSATQAHSGTKSMRMTSTAGGTMTVNLSALDIPVMPGTSYTVTAYFWASTVGRSCDIGLDWFDVNYNYLSSTNGTPVTDTTNGWTQMTQTATVPSNAAYVNVIPRVASTGAGGEIHYVDDLGLFIGSSVPANVDVITRVFVGARSFTDNTATHPATDAATRVFQANRAITETVTTAADATTRIVQFNRTRTETTPTQPALDSSTRIVAASRARTETTGTQPATDTVARTAQFNRTLGEGPGDYPANNAQKAISGTVKDEDTGTPISGITVYLIRSSDLVYTGKSVVTDGSGNYTFTRDSGDSNGYLVLVQTDGGATPKHGVSDSNLIPA